MPLTKQDIEEFVQAILDDLTHAGQPAMQSWINKRANEGKANAANGLASRYSIVTDVLDLDCQHAPN